MRTYSNSSSSSGESPLCWRSTNWRISSGDLDNSLTFETSSDFQETVDSSPISTPLVLIPPATESGPCEIQLSFSQKYEIRQIYVRSTARVYEIYYSKNEQSGNEYLCTVRCSIAEREGEVLKAIDIGSLANEGNSPSSSEEGNSATSEDGWVEVKAHRSEMQDLYEATAEINDSDSCTLVTIRLLSLQNKRFVCIDEVYIFADPVVSNEPENQSHPLNSSSTLMSLLVPTFLQLSRSRNVQGQSQHASTELEGHQLEAQSEAAGLADNTKTTKLVENGLISSHLTDNGAGPTEQIENGLIPTDSTDNGAGTTKQVESDLISTDRTDNGVLKTKPVEANLMSTDSNNEDRELASRNKVEAKAVATDSADVAVTKHDSENIVSKLTDSGEGTTGLQNADEVIEQASVSFQDANGSTVDHVDNLLPRHIPDKDTYSPDNRVEMILEQLLCRVTKIEDVCSRFEESMLKPMKNMEMRIQHVEQQLNLLANNSQYSGLPQYGRFSALSFSCDSNSGALHNDGCNYQLNDSNVSKDFTFSDLKPRDNGVSNSPQSGMPQYTRFSAPSFSCDSNSGSLHDNGCSTFSNLKPLDNGMFDSPQSGSPQYTRFSAPSFSCDSNSGSLHDNGCFAFSNLKPPDNGMSDSPQSGLPQYTRFSAPSFSCDSNSGSLHDDGCSCDSNDYKKKVFTFSILKPCDNGMSNSLQSGLPLYTRFSAPSFSCDLTSNSCGSSEEFEKKDFTINGVSSSVNSSNLSPYLVVTVPEFTGEDDQAVDGLKSIHGIPGGNPKCSEDVGDFPCLVVNVPEFTGDDDLDDDDSKSIHGIPGENGEDAGELKPSQDCPAQNPQRIQIDDLLAASLSELLSASAFHSSEVKQTTDAAASENKISLLEDLLTLDSCSDKEHSSYPRSFTAPEFTFGENCGEEYSEFQFVPLSTSGIERKKDDVCSSVPSSSLSDSTTPLSWDSEFVCNDCPAAVAPVEKSKGLSNPHPKGEIAAAAAAASSETVFSFDFFKGGIEATEPLPSQNVFPSSGANISEVAESSNNGGSRFNDPGVRFNQDTVFSLI